MPNFMSQGFKIKDICHRSLYFVFLFLLGHLLVQVTWWYLASDGSEIQASMEFPQFFALLHFQMFRVFSAIALMACKVSNTTHQRMEKLGVSRPPGAKFFLI